MRHLIVVGSARLSSIVLLLLMFLVKRSPRRALMHPLHLGPLAAAHSNAGNWIARACPKIGTGKLSHTLDTPFTRVLSGPLTDESNKNKTARITHELASAKPLPRLVQDFPPHRRLGIPQDRCPLVPRTLHTKPISEHRHPGRRWYQGRAVTRPQYKPLEGGLAGSHTSNLS